MKAIYYAKYGPPEVLQLKEVEKPVPRGNEVLVRILAASVNSWDWDLLRGKPYVYRLLFGLFKPKHRIIGCDIAGRVEAVGKGVTRFKAGDDVLGDISACWGGFAEYVAVNESLLTMKPASIPFEAAASIPQAAVLAWQSLTDKKQIGKGTKVLINGAGGGVGTFAVQLAKLSGGEVTCVDSANKLKMLLALGADHVIDYTQEDFTANGEKYDLIVDLVASRSVYSYQRALSPAGHLVIVGGTISALLQAGILGQMISLTSDKKISILVHQANKDLDRILELITEGKISPVIDKFFTLKQVPQALQYLGDGHVQGKVVITINGIS